MKLRKILKLVLLYWFLSQLPLRLSADENKDVQYRFTQTDSSYSFYGSFKIKACTSCLIEIFSEHNHIKALSPDAKEVNLIEKGIDYTLIQYKYRKFKIFESISVWNRNLDIEKQRVDFTLVSGRNNQPIMPGIIASSGYFHAFRQGDYMIVEYYQQCLLTKKLLTSIFINEIKKGLIHFIYRFSEYAYKNCGTYPVT